MIQVELSDRTQFFTGRLVRSARNCFVVLLLVLLVWQTGCRCRRVCSPSYCANVVNDIKSYPTSNAVPGVTEDFSQIGGFGDAQVLRQPGNSAIRVLSLEDALCVAAQNARTARLLESQLARLNQIQNARCPGALTLAIQTQIANERSQSASLAGQAFLGLVEVELQRNLLVEAQQKLIELNQTIKEADEKGFATAEAKEVVERQTIKIAEREAELNFNAQKLESQLKALLDLPASDDIELSYHLNPVAVSFDLEAEKASANSQRIELIALRQTLAQWNECSAESAKSLLSAADPRMGVELAKVVFDSRWPILSLLRKRRLPEFDQCENQSLRQQTEKLLQDSEDAVGLSVEEAILETQYAYEAMVLANQEIARLENQIERIRAKKDIDATAAYLDLQKNWYDTLVARSNRISQAVKFESGQIRLAHATGELLRICGGQFSLPGHNGL